MSVAILNFKNVSKFMYDLYLFLVFLDIVGKIRQNGAVHTRIAEQTL